MNKKIKYYDKKIKKAHKALKTAYNRKLEFCKFFEQQGQDIINEIDAVHKFDLCPSEVKHLRSDCDFFEDDGEKFYNEMYLTESVQRYRDSLVNDNEDEDENIDDDNYDDEESIK